VKRTIKEYKVKASVDEAGLLLDMAIYTLAKDIEGYWDGFEARVY